MAEAVAHRHDLPPVEESVPRPETASMTLLKRMNVCPRSAYLDLKYRQIALQTHPMARGSAFHDFAERAVHLLMEQGEPSMPGDVSRDLMQSVIEERKDLVLSAKEQDHLRGMAWNWGSASFFGLKEIVGVEQLLTINLAGWTIRGRVDLIEVAKDICTVRDWKTSYYLPKTSEVEHDFQLMTYCLLAAFGSPEDKPYSPAEGCNEFRAKLVFPRYTLDETGELAEREVVVTRTQLYEFQSVIERLLGQLDYGLETGEWPAAPGSWCNECPAQSECPLPEALREIDEITSPEDATSLAERIHLTDLGLRRMRKTAKAWAEENGDIEYGDYALTFSKTESHPVDREALENAATAGKPFDPDSIFQTRVSTRFDKRKKEKSDGDTPG